ncbi:LamG-like jellyroll fold domain-containing protein [Nannocystis punicea]|uniref:LamG-like jellyroll fold domain-containing protein n=1 Tax=Nannocystis punicea TaxID=2995304 RepID=A0ABY7GXS2_9BACT|nr:LamG-like jellyroll fold domain-containing protein [Nannocystis poenicansa]WAS91756.1 hypothetical protein O0S08_36705 [Nannocystis poenicansa]
MKTTSLSFNGSGTRVEIANSSELQLIGDQTVELWVRPASLGKRQNPIAKAFGGEGTITVEPDGALNYYYGTAGDNAGPYQGFAAPAGTVVIGEWTHLAVVRDLGRKVLRWYRNGVQIAEAAAQFPAAKASNLPLLLGQGYVEKFHGHLAEVRLWSTVRSQAQIQEDMRRHLLGNETGLAGYWPLDEGAGAVARDGSGRGNNGTIATGQWEAIGPSIQPRFAALRTDGSNHVELSNTGALVLGGKFTQECWICPAFSDDSYHGFLGNQPDGGVPQRSPSLWIVGKRQIHFAFGDGTAQQGGVTGAVLSGQRGRWHHVAATFDGGTYRIYVDGALVHTSATSKPPVASPVRWIGRVDNSFVGDLAEVRLWKVARTQAQIQADMNRRLQGTESGLVGYWPLDDGPGARAADLGPNAAHGALVTAVWSADGPGLPRPTALRLAGGWVDLSNNGGLVLGGAFTQECWIQPALADDNYHGFLGNQPAGGVPQRSPSMWVVQKRKIHVAYGDGAGQQGDVTGNVLSGEAGRWHHVAATFDGSNYRVHVDGALVHTFATSKPPVASPVKWIGRVDNSFVGAITDVRLWNRARSQAEIAADMHRRLYGSEPGLVGYWPLDGASGEGLEDRARTGAPGVLQGDARLAAADHQLPVASPWSPALQLGGSDFVELPDSSALVLGGRFTQECWIQPALADDNYHGFLGNQPAGGVPQRSPSLWVVQKRKIHVAYGDGAGQQGGVTGPVLSGEAGRWHHVAATFDGSNYRIYVDGALVHTFATSKPPVASPVKWIGRVDNTFVGAVAEVRLWNVVRSQAEIQADMHRRLWGMEAGLVGYWPLSDGGGTRARDRSATGNHGNLSGAPRWRTGVALQASSEALPGDEPVVGDTPSGVSSLGASTGPSSQVQPLELPAAVKNLGELQAEILFVPFGLPIVFEGAVTVQPLEKAASYAGKVTLTAPFKVTVDPLALNLGSGDDGLTWMVKFGLPQSSSIAAIVQAEVLSKIPGSVRPAIEAVVMPYLALYGSTTIILANEDGEDEQLGSYLDGVNMYATLSAAAIPPFNLIHATFPQLGLASRSVVLAVGTSRGAEQNFFVGATLQLDVELGTPLVVFESLALNVSKQLTDTTAGAVIAFRLDLGGEVLQLRGGIEVATGVGNSVSVWGALDAADGAWKDPFGVRGLTIVGLGVQVGATPVFPFVVLGVRGEVHIGGGLLGARVGIKIDASDWSKCILDIYSEEGIDLPRLIDALTGAWLDVGSVLDVSIKDLQLYLAPKGGTIAGQSYPPGLKLGGRLDLWGFKASVAGQLDFDEGGSLVGAMDPIVLSGGGVEFLRVSAVNGNGGAAIDVVLKKTQVGGTVDGQFSLLGGVYKSQVKATLSTSGFTANLNTGTWGIYQNASVTLTSAGFQLTFGPTIGVSVTIGGFNVNLSVGTSITTKVDSSAFSQGISFSFAAMGTSYNPGPFSVSVPFKDVAALAAAFYQYAKDLIVNGLLGPLVQAGQVAFEWVKANVTPVAKDAAKFFENVGAKSADIAKGLVNTFGVGAGEAVKMLSIGANEAAKILKTSFGWTTSQTGQFLKDSYGLGADALNTALSGAGYAANEIESFFGSLGGDFKDFFEDVGDTLDPTNW